MSRFLFNFNVFWHFSLLIKIKYNYTRVHFRITKNIINYENKKNELPSVMNVDIMFIVVQVFAFIVIVHHYQVATVHATVCGGPLGSYGFYYASKQLRIGDRFYIGRKVSGQMHLGCMFYLVGHVLNSVWTIKQPFILFLNNKNVRLKLKPIHISFN